MMNYKLGLKPREFKVHIPYYSMLHKENLVPLSPSTNWSHGMPSNFGMMLNDQLGDCTCAAYYHARQIWTYDTVHVEVTEPDLDVLELYEQAAGYVQGDPNTDQGATCEAILAYILKNGAPVGESKRHPIIGFVEINLRNLDDVKRAIYETGMLYLGFEVPQYILPNNAPPPHVWGLQLRNSRVVGGHCVVLCGYDNQGFDVISWGQRYRMTPHFLQHFGREAYAIFDPSWFNASNEAPMGLSLQTISTEMGFVRAS